MGKEFDILIVDDDSDIRESLRIILEGNGYKTRSAKNGSEALDMVKASKPDLIILDIMMTTDTEGFDLAYELKNMQGFENLPIIMLTSFLDKVREDGPDQFQHVLGENWPAKWFFEKPVDTKRLLEKINGLLS